VKNNGCHSIKQKDIYSEEITKVALFAENIKCVNIDSRNVIASIQASSRVRCSVKPRNAATMRVR